MCDELRGAQTNDKPCACRVVCKSWKYPSSYCRGLRPDTPQLSLFDQIKNAGYEKRKKSKNTLRGA